MALYPRLIAPLLFKQDAETVHLRVAKLMESTGNMGLGRSLMRALYSPANSKDLEQVIWGKKFSHPIGLAAGFDKDARTYKALGAMGFSFVEIGTVTPKSQPGNPTPRLFRLKEDHALINRMGFNNEGVDAAAARLESRGNQLIGGNIGKNKVTPNEEAAQDYLIAFDKLFDKVDYFTVNVSSPNTPGLRALQDKEPLTNLLSLIQERNHAKATPKPILLKIAPDMEEGQLDDIVDVVNQTSLAGVVATNTTIDRSSLKTSKERIEEIGAGGLSGIPVRNRSTQVVQMLRNKLGNEPIIIGVGGIENGRDAIEKIVAGANLVQVYTGFIYQGPAMVKRCVTEMRHGLKTGHWAWPHQIK